MSLKKKKEPLRFRTSVCLTDSEKETLEEYVLDDTFDSLSQAIRSGVRILIKKLEEQKKEKEAKKLE
jgi:Arc/MetJ-type ribon-helix-helix transcriptional regulator